MSSRFNTLYHGSSKDLAGLLEHATTLTKDELGALLCNMLRKIIALEAQMATIHLVLDNEEPPE